jgi:hypothetical protein
VAARREQGATIPAIAATSGGERCRRSTVLTNVQNAQAVEEGRHDAVCGLWGPRRSSFTPWRLRRKDHRRTARHGELAWVALVGGKVAVQRLTRDGAKRERLRLWSGATEQ